jgi:DNA-binding NarL/FixJ family response regulator
MRTIVIVDDHLPFRVVARELLERDGFRVVGEAGDGAGALDAVLSLTPQVVLLDVNLPGDDGFRVCERMQQLPKVPAIVLTSSHAINAFRHRLLASRARGFISKADLTPVALAALLDAEQS